MATFSSATNIFTSVSDLYNDRTAQQEYERLRQMQMLGAQGFIQSGQGIAQTKQEEPKPNPVLLLLEDL